MTHFINVCAHGIVLGQCRCLAGNKSRVLVECPTYHHDMTMLPVVYEGSIGREARPISAVNPDAPIPYAGEGSQFQVDLDPAKSADHDALVALIKRISPIKHEPLATYVAEEWAAEFEKEGWHR